MEWILMIAGLAVALVAGVFPGFSEFIMRGLVHAPASQGTAGMVGVNRTVNRSVFMVLLLGLVPASRGLGLMALWPFAGAARALILDVAKREREAGVHHDRQARDFLAGLKILERVRFCCLALLPSTLLRHKRSCSDITLTMLASGRRGY